MRFFEVNNAVDAMMSAAMLAQTKAGSRNKQGKLSMNGFLQMLANSGIMMDYDGFKTVFDTNPQLANVIEKFDKDSITFKSADGDVEKDGYEEPRGEIPDDERITRMASRAMRTREFKESIVIEGPRTAIETLKAIVANKQNMPVKFTDGQMQVDLYTASAITQVYDKVNDANKAKLDKLMTTKGGMLRVSDFVFEKGFKKESVHDVDVTEDYDPDSSYRRLKNMQKVVLGLGRSIEDLYNNDNGDLQDQIQTMTKLVDQFEEVLKRSYRILPIGANESVINEVSKAEIDELEDNNQHSEVALKLVQAFGNDYETKVVKLINARHDKRGHILHNEQKIRDQIITKYYKMLDAEEDSGYDIGSSDRQDLKPTNTSATQGKRMGSNAEEIKANEGSSPHKKGTKQFKLHMAAKHAGMNETQSMKDKFKNFLAEGMKDKIAKDIENGMSTDAIIGKHANKRTDNTDEIRKIIKDIKFKERMKKGKK